MSNTIAPIDNDALRRRFNPDGSLLRRQQERMLSILVEVDRICRRHSIGYWLASGTLLGAMRHDGFIPWDDDVDIELMRDDYLRLMEILPDELPTDMALQTSTTDPNYFFCYAKVRDRRSRMSELNNYDRAWRERGIYIDIMPVERHPLWVHRFTELSFGHIYKIWRTSTDDAKAMSSIRRIYAFNTRVIYPVMRFISKLIPGRRHLLGMGIPYRTSRYREEIFPLSTHVFEGHVFLVPHDADAYLRNLYGDWTKLPHLDTVNTHVADIEID